jgi:hypothetical protein
MIKGNHVHFQSVAGHFLSLDGRDLTHAMGGVDDLIAYGEIMTGKGEGVGHGEPFEVGAVPAGNRIS